MEGLCLLELERLVVVEGELLTHAGDDDPCTLLVGFLGDEARQRQGIGLVQMADGLVQQEEVVGLAEAADERHTLLLPQ